MKVAIAIIVDNDNRILITQRPAHVSHGGFWEFPGGKLEGSETPLEAIKREISEEVGLTIIDAQYLTTIEETYNTKPITLLVYYVDNFHGTAVCRESQLDLKWITFNELCNYQFPKANEDIAKLIMDRFLS